MINTLSQKGKSKEELIILHYMFFHFVFFQIIGILRSAAIYDTSYLANYSNMLISIFFMALFVVNLKNLKLKLIETYLLVYPLMNFLYGVIINGLNRNTFSHLFTSVVFASLLIYMRNSNFIFTKKYQLKFANWMFWGLLISIVSYRLAPLIGIRIYSVGIVSIFSLFPLIVFFHNKNRVKMFLTLILLFLGGKRGVLLSGFLSFIFIGLGQKSVKRSSRIIVLVISFGLLISFFYFSMTPERIMLLPTEIQPMFYRMMHINPFSEYSRLESDARILEVQSAMAPLIEQPIYFLTGKGVGFTYEYFDAAGNFQTELHNTHISPVAILARYGIIYTIALYTFIFRTIYINYKRMKRNKLSVELKILLIYSIASFINSFTAFTIYIDYLFILSLGLLNSKFIKEIREIESNN